MIGLRDKSSDLDLARHTGGAVGLVSNQLMLEGAGGIGGLLAVHDRGTDPNSTADDLDYVYLYDGNGNVGQVIDPNAADPNTAVKAKYQYDPYGSRIGSDPNEYNQPWRFSTKQFDAETGLGYWGYRYYSPGMGRWIGRDPIGEVDGVCLYAYVHNAPCGSTDAQGHQAGPWIGNPCLKPPPPPANRCDDCSLTCTSGAGQRALGGDAGGVICRPDGCRCACLDTRSYPGGPPGSSANIEQRCALRHEETHVSQGAGNPCWGCSEPDASGLSRAGPREGVCGFDYPRRTECSAYGAEVECLLGALRKGECGADRGCVERLRAALVETVVTACRLYRCGAAVSNYADLLHRAQIETIKRACPVAPAGILAGSTNLAAARVRSDAVSGLGEPVGCRK